MREKSGARIGGVVLTALMIGGVATTFGAATAGAEAFISGSSTGSVEGGTPWLLDEALDDLLRGCAGEPFFPDFGPCYTNGFWSEGRIGDYHAVYYGPQEVEPGAEAEFTAIVVAEAAAFADPNREENVDVTSVTFLAPQGFEFVDAQVDRSTVTDTPSLPPYTGDLDLPSTVSLNPDSGEVVVTAPAGGWTIYPGRNGHGMEMQGAIVVKFTLRAPDGRVPGSTTGFAFTGTSVPASDGWIATGNTRVWPESAGGTGS